MSFALPEGWRSQNAFSDRYTVITAPMIGAVTIDWKDRVIRGGAVWHGPGVGTKKYRGRNWNVRIVLDAVAWLEAIGDDRKDVS